MRMALRYYGGKARLAPWIIAQFPPHVCYVEPFSGAASVLLSKEPSQLEVLNDLDGEIVNFFRVLRERPDDLIRAIDLTPFARAEAELACEADDDGRDPVERARRLYVRSYQTMHGAPRPNATRMKMGWRYERTLSGATNAAMWGRTEHLWEVAARLKGVQIERGDALRVMERFDAPTTLFYVDPPYVASTRGDRWAKTAYAHEMTDADHEALAHALHGLKGMVVLSGYPSPLYALLYRDWRKVSRMSAVQSSATAEEVLWLNPACGAQAVQPALDLEAAG